MRFQSSPLETALLSALVLPHLVSAISLDCTKAVVNDKVYDLRALGGPRSTIHSLEHGGGTSFTKSVYTIDICKALRPAKDEKNKEHRCPTGTRGMSPAE